MSGSTSELESVCKLDRAEKCLEARQGQRMSERSLGLENAQKLVKTGKSPKTCQGVAISLGSTLAKALEKILDQPDRQASKKKARIAHAQPGQKLTQFDGLN